METFDRKNAKKGNNLPHLSTLL